MGRDRRSKGRDTGRIAGGFIALPWSVVDSPAYMDLSYPAKALLIEIDRQYVRDNNGRLLASRAYLKKRGWKSQDVITRALRELINAKLIHKTVQGHRPNKASWFAVTWRRLDRIAGYDFGASENFDFGGFNKMAIKCENTNLKPLSGTAELKIVPCDGVERALHAPPESTVVTFYNTTLAPSGGHHLDMPSTGEE